MSILLMATLCQPSSFIPSARTTLTDFIFKTISCVLNVSRLREWDVLTPTLFLPAVRTLFWVSSRTKYIDEGQVQGWVHSYRGAKLLDLCDVINHYPNQELNTVVVTAGFKNHPRNIETFKEHSKFLIQLIIVKFSPNNLIVPKVIPLSCNRLINKKKSVLLTTLCIFILILVS